ncbi:MAG: EFR1 family ferrodoxin [Clostridiales bacterium]|jgi:ferredoxin|nr:EFR1 family ferrodoxin [Clostridiales bacterium]MCI1962371.1 EFR1 family ferrodoxin [Clostridiales bacterium]MCI2022817.1 EFR1 family ferrodoxin [Clostridiales bacterium]MCI2027214.1 EFR1 family ferrodoxin [Clostridiales bacterium]
MDIQKLHLVYFSPTGTTQSILREAAKFFSTEIVEHDLTDYTARKVQLEIGKDNFVLLGFPVYGGRVPETFRERMKGIKGRCTPAALIATYGNREYEDALLEMKDISEENGFLPIDAAAIVTEHSVIQSIATGRPDAKDRVFIEKFYSELKKKVLSFSEENDFAKLVVPGKKPYRRYIKLPMAPVVTTSCTACGLCAKKCPVDAIDAQNPRKTDRDKCIGCMRCVRVCSQKARHLPKLKMAVGKFYLSRAKHIRKEPEMYI